MTTLGYQKRLTVDTSHGLIALCGAALLAAIVSHSLRVFAIGSGCRASRARVPFSPLRISLSLGAAKLNNADSGHAATAKRRTSISTPAAAACSASFSKAAVTASSWEASPQFSHTSSGTSRKTIVMPPRSSRTVTAPGRISPCRQIEHFMGSSSLSDLPFPGHAARSPRCVRVRSSRNSGARSAPFAHATVRITGC